MHLSDQGQGIHILDNPGRRLIGTGPGVQPSPPTDSGEERWRVWTQGTGRLPQFHLIGLAREYDRLRDRLSAHRADAVIHFAGQGAAPFAMKSDRHKGCTANDNVSATHNLLTTPVEAGGGADLVHLGTTGVYGYVPVGAVIP